MSADAGPAADRRQHLANGRRPRGRVRDARRRRRLVAGRRRPAPVARARQPGGHRRGASRAPGPDRGPRRPLARPERPRDANGEAVREYRDDSISHVVGYASRQYGTAGLERTYNAELIGLGGSDPFARPAGQVRRQPPLAARAPDDRSTSRLQHAAIEGLGADHGAVVMLDPSTGDVLALASTPTYDAAAIADPDTAGEAFAALRDDESDPLLPRATMGRYVPGSVFKIVTAIAGLEHRPDRADTTFPEQPKAEDKGLLVEGFRIKDGHHPQTGDTPLDLDGRDRGELQHLVRAGGPRDRGRRPRLPGGRCWASARRSRSTCRRRSAAVTDGGGPRAGRLRRRRRARVGVVRPGRDVRHAAPDGARGVDRRERRRADAAAPRERS